jgi:hypothetical protein
LKKDGDTETKVLELTKYEKDGCACIRCSKFLQDTNRWKTVILVNNIEVTLISAKI